MFSMIEIRPDIIFAISVVSRFAKNPSCQHTKVVKIIMRYLKITKSVKITYGREERKGRDFIIKKYSDSDWSDDYATRKSTSGFLFELNRGLISWCAKRQAIVALLLTEAKYVALTLAAKKVTRLKLLLTELGLFKTSNQYIKIKVIQGSTGTRQILADIRGQKEEAIPSTAPNSKPENVFTMQEVLSSEITINIPLLLKDDNQGFIMLAYNPVFHT